MSFVRDAKPLGEPIASDNDRQCAESAHWNGVPGVDAARISRERSKHGETGEYMRMPGKRVIAQRACGFRQNACECDESEGLPKFRRLEPDKKSRHTAAPSGEEAANRALAGIVAQSGQLGGEIERCTENRNRKQPHPHVRVLWGFQMQIDDDAAIESKRAEESILHLQVARFESAAKSRESNHDGGESERGPIVREKSPGGGCGSERTEIRMDGQQGASGGAIEKMF